MDSWLQSFWAEKKHTNKQKTTHLLTEERRTMSLLMSVWVCGAFIGIQNLYPSRRKCICTKTINNHPFSYLSDLLNKWEPSRIEQGGLFSIMFLIYVQFIFIFLINLVMERKHFFQESILKDSGRREIVTLWGSGDTLYRDTRFSSLLECEI